MTMSESLPRITVGLLFGGRSAEHEVSRASAANVLRALDPARDGHVLWRGALERPSEERFLFQPMGKRPDGVRIRQCDRWICRPTHGQSSTIDKRRETR